MSFFTSIKEFLVEREHRRGYDFAAGYLVRNGAPIVSWLESLMEMRGTPDYNRGIRDAISDFDEKHSQPLENILTKLQVHTIGDGFVVKYSDCARYNTSKGINVW